MVGAKNTMLMTASITIEDILRTLKYKSVGSFVAFQLSNFSHTHWGLTMFRKHATKINAYRIIPIILATFNGNTILYPPSTTSDLPSCSCSRRPVLCGQRGTPAELCKKPSTSWAIWARWARMGICWGQSCSHLPQPTHRSGRAASSSPFQTRLVRVAFS